MQDVKESVDKILAEVLADDPFAFACARLSRTSITLIVVGVSDRERARNILSKYSARVVAKRDSLIAVLPLPLQ
jgi:hypothetical protein